MDFTILLTKLKNGNSYIAKNSEGVDIMRHDPPNRYMLSAAEALERLLPRLQHAERQVLVLQQEREILIDQLDKFRANVQSHNVSTSIEQAPGDTGGVPSV